jgi:hypothetical protein
MKNTPAVSITAKTKVGESSPTILYEHAVPPGYTTAPISTGDSNNVMPRWGRWRDVQRLYGVKRGTLYNLTATGKIKSVSIRREGNVHGCRLFFLPSIDAYLSELLTEQDHNSVKE